MKKLLKCVAVLTAMTGVIACIQERVQTPAGGGKRGVYETHVKRPLDAMLAFLGLVFLSPVMCVVAVLVRKNLGSPVLFRQERPGKIDPRTGKEKIFSLYKFRTMTDARDADGNLLSDGARLTPFGKKLRATSLDELPELINIIRGDMAIVGPRPLLTQYLPYYTNREKRRHDVRPGLTGLAQVSGRNFVKWDERLALDVKYVSRITFLGDLRIIFRTAGQVLRHADVAPDASEADEGYLDEIRRNSENDE